MLRVVTKALEGGEQDGDRERGGAGRLGALGRQSEQRGDPGDGETEQQQHSGGSGQGCGVGVQAEADEVSDAEHEGDDEHVPQRVGQGPAGEHRGAGPGDLRHADPRGLTVAPQLARP
jgi:hypothetical protein